MSKKLLGSMLAALAVTAFAAAPALATEVTPASSAFTAKLVAGTSATFTPENGSFAVTVSCEASSTTGTTPSSTLPMSGPPFFNNRPASNPPSLLAGGSVLANLATPTFTTCTSAPGVTTSVATNSTNGKWSIDWNVLNSQASPWTTAAVGVPKAGAAITLTAGTETCVLTIDPETAQGVIGYWQNGAANAASKLFVNEQVFYAPTAATKTVCEGATFKIKASDSPAAFKAAYNVVKTGTEEGIIETWS
jgi:hypothetical protein